jgi:hypothetical protein
MSGEDLAVTRRHLQRWQAEVEAAKRAVAAADVECQAITKQINEEP